MSLDVFNLHAKIDLDTREYTDGISKAKGMMSSLGGAVKTGLTAVASMSATAVAGAASGVVALTKSAVSAYGEYEQLVGGVDKLYGEASQKLQDYAADAYKTSGLSANEYMSQATSFSAALINSLDGDTARAAELTDVAMRAISDNFNTFGSDIQSVQNAYQGFAKQNYTMLDNLKLGYGGTKTEMRRLIADANEYAESLGMASDLSINSFADIVQAIELVQEKQHIAGTTAKEAASTIQGSIGMAKSAWTNLVAGLANPQADINKLVRNFTDSANQAIKNLLPTIKTGLQGVSSMVTEVLPEIFAMLPDLIDEVMPSLMETIDVTITQTFPALIQVVSKNMPLLIKTIASSGKTIVKSVFDAINQQLSGNRIYDSLKNGVANLSKTFKRVGDSLFEDGKRIFASVTDLANRIDIDGIFASIQHAAEVLAPSVEKAGDGLVWLFDNAISPLIEWAANDILPVAIDTLAESFRILQEAGEFLQPVATAVWDEFLKPLGEWTADIGTATLTTLKDTLKDIADYFDDIDWQGYWEDYDEFEENWKTGASEMGDILLELDKKFDDFFEDNSYGDNWNQMWQTVGGAIFDAKEKANSFFDALEKNGEDAFDKMDSDITTTKENWELWQESFNEVIDNYKEGFKDVGDTLAPIGEWFFDRKEGLEKFGEKVFDIKEGIIDFYETWETESENIGESVNDKLTDVKDTWDTGVLAMWDGIDKVTNKFNDFKDKLSSGAETIQTKLTNVKEHFGEIRTFITDLAKDAYTWGSDLVNNFIDGVKSLGEDWDTFWEDFGGSIADYIGFSEPEKGELSKFHTFAPDMIDLFTKGITENADKPLRAIDSMLGDIKDSFTVPIASDVSGYTPYTNISGYNASDSTDKAVTLQLVDGAYNVIARGVANPLDIINGTTLKASMRGRQS